VKNTTESSHYLKPPPKIAKPFCAGMQTGIKKLIEISLSTKDAISLQITETYFSFQ
jgi:hypothetical protein